MIKYCYTNQKYTTTTYNYDFKDYTHSLYEIVFNDSIVNTSPFFWLLIIYPNIKKGREITCQIPIRKLISFSMKLIS